jgi:hypothetical protein
MEGGQTFSVQIGSVANRVGAEHWNRGSEGNEQSWQNGVPIVLCVDAKNGMGSMPLAGRPELVVEDVKWEGEKTLIKRPVIKGWSEKIAVRMAEKSFFALEGLRMGVMIPFESFDDGIELLNSSTTEQDSLENAMRYWSETCDRIESVRVLFDGWNGFGGVAEVFTHYIAEEHAKVSVLCVVCFFIPNSQACVLSVPLERDSSSHDSTAKCITRVTSSVCVPLRSKEEEEEEEEDVFLLSNVSVLLKPSPRVVERAARGLAHLCWAKKGEEACNQWTPQIQEDELLSSVEIEKVMKIAQSKHIGKMLKTKLQKLDEQTANEISLLAERYFN